MRIGSKLTLVFLLMLTLSAVVACTTNGQNENDVDTPEIKGPALVMFYSDN